MPDTTRCTEDEVRALLERTERFRAKWSNKPLNSYERSIANMNDDVLRLAADWLAMQSEHTRLAAALVEAREVVAAAQDVHDAWQFGLIDGGMDELPRLYDALEAFHAARQASAASDVSTIPVTMEARFTGFIEPSTAQEGE